MEEQTKEETHHILAHNTPEKIGSSSHPILQLQTIFLGSQSPQPAQPVTERDNSNNQEKEHNDKQVKVRCSRSHRGTRSREVRDLSPAPRQGRPGLDLKPHQYPQLDCSW